MNGRSFVMAVIRKYREHPCLWQLAHEDYHNKAKRNIALEDLVALFKTVDRDANKETVFRKINSLRSCFRKELNKVKTSIRRGAEEIHIPKLWYYEQMLFLEDQENIHNPQTEISEMDQTHIVYKEESSVGTDLEEADSLECSQESRAKRPRTESEGRPEEGRPAESRPAEGRAAEGRAAEGRRQQHDAFGEYVAEQLRAMSPGMVPFCQRLINEALYLGTVRLLGPSSRVFADQP